jgi:hypothetical protein
VLADYCVLAARKPGSALGLVGGGLTGALHTLWDMAHGAVEFLTKEPDLSKMLQEAIKICAYLRDHGSQLPAQLEAALTREVQEIQALYAKGDPASLFQAGHRVSHMATTAFVAIEGALGSGKTLGNLGNALLGKAVSVRQESVIVGTLKNLKPEQASQGVKMANYLAEHPEKAVRVPKEVMTALKTGLEKNADQPGVRQALNRLKEMQAPGSTRMGPGASTSSPPPQFKPQPQSIKPVTIGGVTARRVPVSRPADLAQTFQREIKETIRANERGLEVSLVIPLKDSAVPGGVRLERIDNLSPKSALALLTQLSQQNRLDKTVTEVFNYNGIGGRTAEGQTVKVEDDLRQRENKLFFTPAELDRQAGANALVINGKRSVCLPLSQWNQVMRNNGQANKHGNTVSLAIQRQHTFQGPDGQTLTMTIVEAWGELTSEETLSVLYGAAGLDKQGNHQVKPSTLVNPNPASGRDAIDATLAANGLSQQGLKQRNDRMAGANAGAGTTGVDTRPEAKVNADNTAIDAALKTEWDARAQWVRSTQERINALPISGVATPYRDAASKALDAYIKLSDSAFLPLKLQLAKVEKALALFSNGLTGQVKFGGRTYSLNDLKADRDSLSAQVKTLNERLLAHKNEALHYLEQGRQKLDQIATPSQKKLSETVNIRASVNPTNTHKKHQPGDAYIGDIFKFKKYYPVTDMVINGLNVRLTDVLDAMRTHKITALEAMVQLKPDLLRGVAAKSPSDAPRFVTHNAAYDTNEPYDQLAELASNVSAQLLVRGTRAVDVASLIAENKQQFTMWNSPNRVTEFNELQPDGRPNPTFLVADPESRGKKSESGYGGAAERVIARLADEPDCARIYVTPDNRPQKSFGGLIDYVRQQDTNGAWATTGNTITDSRWLSNRLQNHLVQRAYDQPILLNQVIRIPIQTPHGTGGALYIYERQIARRSIPQTPGEPSIKLPDGYKLEVMLDQGTAAWKAPELGMRQHVSQQAYKALDGLLRNNQLSTTDKLQALAGIWYDLSATSGGWMGGGAGTNHILMAAAYERITGRRMPALKTPADLLAISNSREVFIGQFMQGKLFQ